MHPVTHIAGIHSLRLWLDTMHAAIVLSLRDVVDSLCTGNCSSFVNSGHRWTCTCMGGKESGYQNPMRARI